MLSLPCRRRGIRTLSPGTTCSRSGHGTARYHLDACALLRSLPPLAGALVSPTPIALLAAAAVVIPTSHEYPSPIHSPPATFFAPHSPSTPQVAQSRHSKGQVCGEAHGRQIRREHVHRGADATVRVGPCSNPPLSTHTHTATSIASPRAHASMHRVRAHTWCSS